MATCLMLENPNLRGSISMWKAEESIKEWKRLLERNIE